MKRILLALSGAALLAAGLTAPAQAGDPSLGVDPEAMDKAVNTVADHTMTFTPATVVDPTLYGGEPGINFDPSDKTNKRSYADWPVSSRQNIGVLFRSEDGGLSYLKRYPDPTDALVTGGPACVGRQTPYCFAGGGGDTDVNINPTTGALHFGNQEVLVNQATGTSFDKGDTFPSDHVNSITAQTTGVDRQWLGSKGGTKTEYLAYHVPALGEFVNVSTDDGKLGSWSAQPTPQVQGVTQSGALLVDSTGGIHDGAVYIAYLGFPSVNPLGSGFLVAVSTDGAKTFTNYAVPRAKNARNFTKIGLDRKGNLYATWVDNTNNKTFLSTSKADAGTNVTKPGSQWSEPVQVSNGLNVTIFSDVAGGDPGRIAVSYYGTTAKAPTPDDVQKGAGGWSPYVAFTANALCQWDANPCPKGPLFHQTPISHHINQDDNICTAGTTCAATMGNRNLLDYFDISVDNNGHLGFVWSDTTNQTTMPFVKIAMQASGPSLLVKAPKPAQPARFNGMADPAGDARYPFYGLKARTSPSNPVLDLRGTTLRLKDDATLEVRMELTSAATIGQHIPQVGSTDGASVIQQAKYLTRWDFGGRVFYAAASVTQGETAPTFFSGEVTTDTSILAAGGGTAVYGAKYSELKPATGRIDGNALVIDVPVADVGGPAKGAALYSVGSYALLGPMDDLVVLNTIPVTVDSTPTFDAVLSSKVTRAKPPTTVGTPPGGKPSGGPGGSGKGPLATTGASPLVAGLGLLLLTGAAVLRRRRQLPSS